MNDVATMQAAARARAASKLTQQPNVIEGENNTMFVDPSVENPLPVVVKRVVPKVETPKMAKYRLEAFQASFVALVTGKRYMFVNYGFETDNKHVADKIVEAYGGRIWFVE